MTIQNPSPAKTPPVVRRHFIRRHSVTIRVTHWLNAACLSFLLLSGLQIFNAHPRLYWGKYGADADQSFIEIGARQVGKAQVGFLQVGPISLQTTGFLGVSDEGGNNTPKAFPTWLTIPSYHDLGAGRRWHFFFAWLLALNGLIYLAHSIWHGHIRRDLWPSSGQMKPGHLWQEVLDHARLRFARGNAASSYNALQKLSYLAVVFGLLPLMVLTGLTMSPGLNAAFQFLPDLFGGRASARTLHFITAFLLVSFVGIHLVMVIASGLWNNMRSMLNGQYAINDDEVKS